jgi:signal transduction histidine kinase
MSLLKISALTVSGVTLWLAPPFVFSRKIPLHNFLQGVALVSGFACCFEARKGALRLAKAEEFEALKDAAVNADLVDEISTSVYVSEQQRRKEAEEILATNSRTEHEQETELDSIRESLELLLNRTSNDSTELMVANLSTRQQEQIELILQCHAKGISGKNKILKEVWGVSAGSSQAYRNAKAEYEYLMPFVNKEEEEGG